MQMEIYLSGAFNYNIIPFNNAILACGSLYSLSCYLCALVVMDFLSISFLICIIYLPNGDKIQTKIG